MNAPSSSPDVGELIAHAAWIRRLAVQLVRDENAADDLTQDTLLAALEARPAARGSLRPWLARVLRNRIAERFRRACAALQRETEVGRAEALPSSAELVARGELQRRLVEAVLNLDEPARTLVLLRFYEGLEPTEIARRIGRPAGSVRGQLHRALAELRERFASDADGLDWRAAFAPLMRSSSDSGLAIGWLGSLLAPAQLTLMSTLLKLALPLAALGLLAWFLAGAFDRVGPDAAGVRAPADAGEEPQLVQAGPQPTRAPAAVASRSAASAAADVHPPVVDRSPIRGRLRTAGAGEPLRAFAIDVHAEGRAPERVQTDAQGHFVTASDYASGPVELSFVDHPDQDLDVRFGDGQLLRTAAVERRPVDFAAGEELAIELDPRVEVRLELRGPAAVTRELNEVFLDLVAVEQLSVLRVSTPIRSDATGTWARFPELAPLELESPAAIELHVMSADGLWSARVEGPRAIRRHDRRFPLVLEPSARLEVVVPWNGPEPTGLSATLDGSELDVVEATDGEATLFVRRGLDGGSYHLAVWSSTSGVARRELALSAGAVHRETVELEAPESRERLELHVTSRSGRYHGTVSFRAVAPDGQQYAGSSVTWSESNGRWTGTGSIFAPPGDYTIRPFLSRDSIPWDPAGRAASVPGPAARLVALDTGPTETLSLTVLDATTRAPIPELRARLDPGGEPVVFNRPAASEPTGTFSWTHVHGPDAATWQVQADGYVPREGSWESATPTQDGRHLEVLLQRDNS